jgi:DNA (cytosine-5)-methyltransferase 1
VNRYTVVSLFSGAGGLDLGFVLSGRFEILVANDIEEHMVEAYSVNFGARITPRLQPRLYPQVILGDVAKVDFSPLRDEGVNVVIGGPPCQDFSILRSSTAERVGIQVRRGRLYAHFVRALAEIQPEAFVFENVPGLLTANEGLAYKTILEDFENLNLRWDEVRKSLGNDSHVSSNVKGYTILFNEVVEATAFGVAQQRRRLIIVGIRKDLVKKDRIFDVATKFRRLMLGGREVLKRYPLTTMEVFEGLPLTELGARYVEVVKEYEGVWNEVRTEKMMEWKRKVWDRLTFDVVKDYCFFNKINPCNEREVEEVVERTHKALLKEMGYYGVRVSDVKVDDGSHAAPVEPPNVVTKVKMIPFGENFEVLVGSEWELRRKGVSQIYRRLNPLTPSYTVVAYGGGGMAMYHYERHRTALTIREKARLQSFPDSFRFVGSLSNMKAEVGEAVPPLMAKAIASALAKLLDEIL